MRIGIAGLGHVGAAVLRLLRANSDILTSRGAVLKVIAVSARDRARVRDCDLAGIDWVDDPLQLAAHPDIDCVVELIGGAAGTAYALAQATLAQGKHLVTANKAMIAAHGAALARLAHTNNVVMAFEAAVCGSMPVIKLLREGLAANRIKSVRGILNGTCNYILTRMGDDSMDFADALAEAQRLGYAEADPAADIDGHDSACKLAILAALAFGGAPELHAVQVRGIRDVMPADLRQAAERGGRLKLMCQAERTSTGLLQKVEPVFVPMDQPLARIDGVTNAVEIIGNFAGILMLQGAGAGGNTTASAVVADLMDIAGRRGDLDFISIKHRKNFGTEK